MFGDVVVEVTLFSSSFEFVSSRGYVSAGFTDIRSLVVGACDLINCSRSVFRYFLTLKVASAQVIETSVTNNSPSQDSNRPDDHFQSRYVTPGFKSFSYSTIVVLIRA